MRNILKGWFTSIIGAIIIIITGYMIYTGKTTWIWEGIAGITIGTVLLFAPETFEKLFEKLIDKFTK